MHKTFTPLKLLFVLPLQKSATLGAVSVIEDREQPFQTSEPKFIALFGMVTDVREEQL